MCKQSEPQSVQMSGSLFEQASFLLLEAVVQVLVSRYLVASNRLKAHGVGPLVPTASNRTDDDRAKNRRVVLVEQ